MEDRAERLQYLARKLCLAAKELEHVKEIDPDAIQEHILIEETLSRIQLRWGLQKKVAMEYLLTLEGVGYIKLNEAENTIHWKGGMMWSDDVSIFATGGKA